VVAHVVVFEVFDCFAQEIRRQTDLDGDFMFEHELLRRFVEERGVSETVGVEG